MTLLRVSFTPRYRLRLAFNYMDGKLSMTGLSPVRTVPCPAHLKETGIDLLPFTVTGTND